MKIRLIRVALGGALAVAAAAPMSAPAHAWACIGDVAKAVCHVYATGCQFVPDNDGGKVDPHAVCEFG